MAFGWSFVSRDPAYDRWAARGYYFARPNLTVLPTALRSATSIAQLAPYQQNPPRYAYTLTPKGADLKPVLGALAMRAMRHVPRAQPDKELATLLRR